VHLKITTVIINIPTISVWMILQLGTLTRCLDPGKTSTSVAGTTAAIGSDISSEIGSVAVVGETGKAIFVVLFGFFFYFFSEVESAAKVLASYVLF